MLKLYRFEFVGEVFMGYGFVIAQNSDQAFELADAEIEKSGVCYRSLCKDVTEVPFVLGATILWDGVI